MENQNIAFSFDVFNDPSVVSGLTVDTHYFKVYIVSAATSDAAGGSWSVTFTETGKLDETIFQRYAARRHQITNWRKQAGFYNVNQ